METKDLQKLKTWAERSRENANELAKKYGYDEKVISNAEGSNWAFSQIIQMLDLIIEHQSHKDILPQLNKHDCSTQLPSSSATYMLLAGGRTLITGTFDECKDYADKLVKPVGTKLVMVNVVEWQLS